MVSFFLKLIALPQRPEGTKGHEENFLKHFCVPWCLRDLVAKEPHVAPYTHSARFR